MIFDLCVPAHNEAGIIEETLAQIREALEGGAVSWKIVVADNASIDGTADRVRAFADPRITVARIERKGKGTAIIEAAKRSAGDLFGFIDADLSTDPRDILSLLEPVIRGDADAVIGSRLLDRRIVNRVALRSASSRAFNGFRRAFLGIGVEDTQCGLKVMNARAREELRSCAEVGWWFDMEFLARAERAGLRIREVPVHWREHHFPDRKSRLHVVRDGFGALAAMARIRRRLGRS